jgi:hypothetical protein
MKENSIYHLSVKFKSRELLDLQIDSEKVMNILKTFKKMNLLFALEQDGLLAFSVLGVFTFRIQYLHEEI